MLQPQQTVLRKGFKDPACSGECDFSATPVQKPVMKICFERSYLCGDGRLCDVQLLCRTGKALLPRYFEKRPQLIKIHFWAHPEGGERRRASVRVS